MNTFDSKALHPICLLTAIIYQLSALCQGAEAQTQQPKPLEYPVDYGVYALDGKLFTPLNNNFIGRTREEQRIRLTFNPNLSILVFRKGVTEQRSGRNSFAILDWVSLGEKPMTEIPINVSPVENQKDMIMLVPKQPLKAGLYSISSDEMKEDYQFGVESLDLEKYWRNVLQDRPASWQAHNHLGAALYIRGEIKEAAVHFAKAVELKPDNPEVHNNLGLVLSLDGKMDEAIQQYELAVKIKDDSAMRTNLANAYLQVKRYDQAISNYRHAIDLNSQYASPHCNLGYALMKEGKLDDAISEFRKASELDPSMPQAKNDLERALRIKNDGQ